MTRCSSVDPATGKQCQLQADHEGVHAAGLDAAQRRYWFSVPVAELDRQVEAWRQEAAE